MAARLWQILGRFRSDTHGNAVILTTLFMFAAMGFVALDVDVGKVYIDRRKTQSVTDLAAIVAASNIGSAQNAAAATVQQNNFPSSALISVQTGIYTANTSIAAAKRFTASSSASANAVQVTLQTQSPLLFGKLFYRSGAFTIQTKAIAANTALATFAIGSRLASLDNGLLNSVLGGFLGTHLSLSLMDYQSLMSARIDAFDFLNALATQVHLSGVSYSQLLQANVKVADIIQAMATAQTNATGANSGSTLSAIAQSMGGSTATITPQSLISVGPYAAMTVGQAPKSGVAISLFDMLSATAQLASGSAQVTTGLNLTIPGIASASLTAVVGQRPQGTSWLAVGAQGATVNTAQTRVLLNISLLGSGSIAMVNLPVYIEVATGTATLSNAACAYPDGSKSSATLAVTPGIVDAWIGQVGSSGMSNLSSAATPSPAALVNLGLVQITAQAHASMGNMSPTSVAFTYADIQALTKKTVTTTNYTSSLTASLLGNLSLSILGLPLPGIGSLVTNILSSATAPVDQLLAMTLNTLGIGIGQADVWVSGLRCDGAVLVN